MPEEIIPPKKTGTNARFVGKVVGLAIIAGAIIVAVIAAWEFGHRPETDDATLRANFVGIVPHASGHITELRVRDNQVVQQGELLFVIDQRPYEHAVASAKAQLILAHKQVDAAKSAIKV